MKISIHIHSANIGFMLMFSAVVAPVVFKTLSQKAASAYLRVLFPRMFLFGLGTSVIATVVALFEGHETIAVLSSIIASGFLFNAFYLTPAINRYRDTTMDGSDDAKRTFARLHLLSVAVFVGQILTSGYIVISAQI